MDYKHFARVNHKIYFGKYIDNEVLTDLNNIGIDIIIDLTHHTDKMIPYNTELFTIKFPIVDMSVCNDQRLYSLIEKLCHFLKKDQKIYIHCKGGHGRSAVIAACLYGIYYHKTASESLYKIAEAHNRRLFMKYKWRKIGAPQTSTQIKQVFRVLDTI